MNTIKLLLSTTLVTFLVGCETMQSKTTYAQTQSDEEVAKINAANKEYELCYELKDKNYKEARNYVANNIIYIEGKTANKYELFQSQRLFDEADKEPLITYLNETSECRIAHRDSLNSIDMRLGLNANTVLKGIDRESINFMQKKINVSQLNSNIESIYESAQSDWERIAVKKNNEYMRAHNKEVDRNLEVYKAQLQAESNGRQKNVFDEWAETIGDYSDSANSYDMGTQTNCTAYGNNVTCTTF